MCTRVYAGRVTHPSPLPDRSPVARGRARARHTRDAVVETALRLFSEHGYLAVRVEDIAREAGISRATFYKYFSEREEILAALLTRLLDDQAAAQVDRVHADGAAGPDGTTPDVSTRVRALAREVAERTLEREELARFVYALPVRHEALLNVEPLRRPRACRQLDGLLAEAGATGELRADVPLGAARAHVHAAIETALRAWATGQAPDALAEVDRQLDLALYGVLGLPHAG